MEHILAATDLSPASRQGLPWAAALATAYESGSRCCRSTSSRRSPRGTADVDAYFERIREARSAQAGEVRDLLEHLGEWVEAEFVDLPGVAAMEIERFVAEEHVDLVVVTRLGSDAGSRALLGSTTRRLLRRLGCATVGGAPRRRGRGGYRGRGDLRAAAGLPGRGRDDLSEDSKLGLNATCAVADKFGAEVEAVHVWRELASPAARDARAADRGSRAAPGRTARGLRGWLDACGWSHLRRMALHANSAADGLIEAATALGRRSHRGPQPRQGRPDQARSSAARPHASSRPRRSRARVAARVAPARIIELGAPRGRPCRPRSSA